ncbi:hypothetical protein HPB47_004427 [Ixodes persulcatus]|uniref:Uncharacterized protein n=1 Tax=Ixodes persulcatus TaxID=34615 RepID=A0AC60PFY6_IXOPE|nr:hypothetical protein HPB47_004427 [Ixodes persulcatus]
MDSDKAPREGRSSTTLVSERQSKFNFEEARERIKILELETDLVPSETGERGEQDDLQHFSKAWSGVIEKFPSEAEVPVQFEAVETIYVRYRVPRAIWGQLVFPHVVEKDWYFATRLTATELNDYARVKKTVLKELQLTHGE